MLPCVLTAARAHCCACVPCGASPPPALQIAEISVNKQLEGVQKITFDDMFGYDAAIKSLEDDNMELAGALWKCVQGRLVSRVAARARWLR